MNAPANTNDASTGLVATPVPVLNLLDGNCLAIERVVAPNHDANEARVVVFLGPPHGPTVVQWTGVHAARAYADALTTRTKWEGRNIAVGVDAIGVFLAVRDDDGQEVCSRLPGSLPDQVAKMFKRATKLTNEEFTEQINSLLALGAEKEAERAAERAAKEREAEERAREDEEAECELREDWCGEYGDLTPPPEGWDDGIDFDQLCPDQTDEAAGRALIVTELEIRKNDRVTVISGATTEREVSGAMKTFVSVELGGRLAGRVSDGPTAAFDGAVQVLRRGRVLHIDLENPGAEETKLRYRRLGFGHLIDDGTISVVAPKLSFLDPDAKRKLLALIWRFRANYFVVDSLTKFCEDHTDLFSRGLWFANDVIAETNAHGLINAHPQKGWVKEKGLNRLGWLTGREAGSVLWLDTDAKRRVMDLSVLKPQDCTFRMRAHLVDDGPIDVATGLSEGLHFLADGKGETVKARVKPTASMKTTADAKAKVRAGILRALAKGTRTEGGLREVVTGRDTTIRAVLAELVASGEVLFDEATRLYSLP